MTLEQFKALKSGDHVYHIHTPATIVEISSAGRTLVRYEDGETTAWHRNFIMNFFSIRDTNECPRTTAQGGGYVVKEFAEKLERELSNWRECAEILAGIIERRYPSCAALAAFNRLRSAAP